MTPRCLPVGLFLFLISFQPALGQSEFSETGRTARKSWINFETTGDWKSLSPGIKLLQENQPTDLTTRDLALLYRMQVARFRVAGRAGLSSPTDLTDFFSGLEKLLPRPDLHKRDRQDLLEEASEELPSLFSQAIDDWNNDSHSKALAKFKTCSAIGLEVKKMNTWKHPELSIDAFLQRSLLASGQMAAQLELTKEANNYYRAAVNDYPPDSTAIAEYVDFQLKQNQLAEAEKWLQQGQKAFPKYPNWVFQEININLKKGATLAALSAVEKAITQEPNNESLYLTRAQLLEHELSKTAIPKQSQTKQKELIQAYQEVTKRFPKSTDAWYAWGTWYYNRYAGYTKILQEATEDQLPAIETAARAAQQQLIEQGLPAFKQAHRLDPNDMNTLVALKTILQIQNKSEEARRVNDRINQLQQGKKSAEPLF